MIARSIAISFQGSTAVKMEEVAGALLQLHKLYISKRFCVLFYKYYFMHEQLIPYLDTQAHQLAIQTLGSAL